MRIESFTLQKGALILLLLLGLAIFFYFQRSNSSVRPPQTATSVTEQDTRKFLELEALAAEHDATTWAPEIKALECQQVLVRLWDELRAADDEFAVLSRFSFDSLMVPEEYREQAVENGIVRYDFLDSAKKLDPPAYKEWLDQFRSAGYRLEQSEWRHPKFKLPGHSKAESVFDVQLHVAKPATGARFIVKLRLDVTWRLNPGETPFPSQLRARQVSVLPQSSPPAFTHLLSHELQRMRGIETLDPFLMVYDLNSDNFPEIVLGAQNVVLRNTNGAFTPEQLCRDPPDVIHTCLLGDFNSDGSADLLVADLQALWLIDGDGSGRFQRSKRRAWLPPERFYNPFVMTSGDIDADGDLDLWLTQYKLPYVGGQMPTPYFNANDGFPSYLLLNDGAGNFRDATHEFGLAPKRFRRTYSASFADLDSDGDLDLLNVSDFCGLDIFENQGNARFVDVTDKWIREPHAFGMAHAIADFDANGALDILMIGMNSDTASRLDSMGLGRSDFPRHTSLRAAMTKGNRLYSRTGPTYSETPLTDAIAKAGWAWGVVSPDFDNDGDADIYIANGHNSRVTAMDYETRFWRHDIYVGASELNPAHDLFFKSAANKLYGAGYSYGGFYKNNFYLNLGGTNFLEAAHLLGVAIEEDCRNLVSADLDCDGKQDLVFATFEQWPRLRQGIHIFKNTTSGGNWAAFVLEEHPKSTLPGTVVTATLSDGRRIPRIVVTGDSYRSQHPAIVHFGIGEATIVSLEIVRPNQRQRQVILAPTPGKFHRL